MIFPLDHFCRYDELTAFVHELADAYPALVAVESIGTSHAGRDLWLVTVTDSATGPHHEKPAMWVDANIHATELTASVGAIGLLRRLVTGFGTDDTVTAALRTRTFYVVPRVNPDGAELALADAPRFIRSSVRPWPYTDRWAQPGLHLHDVDGNGRILSMRIEDPTGAWTTHDDEPRLMVPVSPTGLASGRRYRMLDEGIVEHHDGYTIARPRPVEGLDLNRNFPVGWGTSVTGSGDYPGSEPEAQALMRAITQRPNVCGTNAYHTFGGVLLRPSSAMPDDSLPATDVWLYKMLGARCTELTGVPVYGAYDDFTWDRSQTMSGAIDDWTYEHLGVFGWTTEFWDPIHAATGERAPTSLWYVTPDPDTELAMLRWFDEHHPGSYVDWTEFDHPQLGRVEIGGWDQLHTWINPPASRLEAEVEPHADFAVFQALTAPCLTVERVTVTPLGNDTWRIAAGIANTGYLATTVTEWAAKHTLVRDVAADLEVGDEVELHPGTAARVMLGQLAGFGQARFSERNDGAPNRALASWIVTGPAGATVTVTARHQRAGTARAVVSLEPTGD